MHAVMAVGNPTRHRSASQVRGGVRGPTAHPACPIQSASRLNHSHCIGAGVRDQQKISPFFTFLFFLLGVSLRGRLAGVWTEAQQQTQRATGLFPTE